MTITLRRNSCIRPGNYYVSLNELCIATKKPKQTNIVMKGQSEIAYLPKFANIMLIVMVIVINEIF